MNPTEARPYRIPREKVLVKGCQKTRSYSQTAACPGDDRPEAREPEPDLSPSPSTTGPPFTHPHTRKGKPEDNGSVERAHRTDDEEFHRLEKRGFKDFMLKASEWIYYYNYDRSHDSLGGKSPAEALQEVNPKLPKDILFLPPIILDDRITLLGGGAEVYRYHDHLVLNAFL